MTPELAATTDLHDWIERIRAGDLAARDELLRGVSRRLEALARRMLKDSPRVHRWSDTGDVLQSASMRLLRAVETVKPASMRDFFNLAALQIRRELIDLARQFMGPEGVGGRHDSQGAVGSSIFDKQAQGTPADMERWTIFHEEVEKLPTEEREVVGLIFYHGWSQDQVAELFQVNVRTIKRWWQSALLKLHHVLIKEMTQD